MTHTPDTEESVVVFVNKALPRRLARNPRREGYERDVAYVGQTDSDIVRCKVAEQFEAAFEAAVDRCPEPTAEDLEMQGKLMSLSCAAEWLAWCEHQLTNEDLARPEISQLLMAMNAFQYATWKIVWKG